MRGQRPSCFGESVTERCSECHSRLSCIDFRLRPHGFGLLPQPRYPVVYVDEVGAILPVDQMETLREAFREAGYRMRSGWWSVKGASFLRILRAAPGHIAAHFRDYRPDDVEEAIAGLDRRSEIAVRPAEYRPPGASGTRRHVRLARQTALGSIVAVPDPTLLVAVAAAVRTMLCLAPHG